MKTRRLLSAVLALMLIFALSTTAFAASFSDVPTSHWAYSAVNDMSGKSIITGYSDGSFKPSGTVTYAEYITMLTKAFCVKTNTALPGSPTTGQAWYDPIFKSAVTAGIMTTGQFTGKENTSIPRSDMALLASNALTKIGVPSDVSAVISQFGDAADIRKLTTAQQNGVAKVAGVGLIVGDDKGNFNPAGNATRAEAATIIYRYLSTPNETVTLLIAAAASLKNVFEKSLIPQFEKTHPNIKIVGTYDSSGKLQTQIESGLEADLFFSAATAQMTALKDKNLIVSDSIVNLLENKIVLIGGKDIATKVTGFANITDAKTIAVGDPASVPAGTYAKEVFTSLGIWDAVSKKATLGTNVTEVLTWVAKGSAEVGVVYATDAASESNVVVIAEAPAGTLKTPVLYPIGITARSTHKIQSASFISYLQTGAAKSIFAGYGFAVK